MTFPTYYLIGFLNSMGWPQKTGLFIKKEVVNSAVLFAAVQASVGSAIALGVAKPIIAAHLLADLFSKIDWPQESTKETWDKLDPYEEICNNPNKTPEETIAPLPLAVSDELKSVIEWKLVFQEELQLKLHLYFVEGLIWGLSHPKEASACHEKQQQKTLKKLPAMLKSGLDVHPLENLNEFAKQAEDVVNSFQCDIRPLVEVPKELLNLTEVKARISQPDLAVAHYNLGITSSKLGHYHEAIESFKQAIHIKPDLAVAHCGLGFAYGELGRHQDAIESYKQTISIEPDLSVAHYNLGNTYGKLGRYQDAIESYKQAIRIKPDYADAHHNLGVAYRKIGNKGSALEEDKI